MQRGLTEESPVSDRHVCQEEVLCWFGAEGTVSQTKHPHIEFNPEVLKVLNPSPPSDFCFCCSRSERDTPSSGSQQTCLCYPNKPLCRCRSLANKQNTNYRSQSMTGWQRIHHRRLQRSGTTQSHNGSGLDLRGGRGARNASDTAAVSAAGRAGQRPFDWQQLADKGNK